MRFKASKSFDIIINFPAIGARSLCEVAIYVHSRVVQDILGCVSTSHYDQIINSQFFSSAAAAAAAAVHPQCLEPTNDAFLTASLLRSRRVRGSSRLRWAAYRSSCYCSMRYLNRATCELQPMTHRSKMERKTLECVLDSRQQRATFENCTVLENIAPFDS